MARWSDFGSMSRYMLLVDGFFLAQNGGSISSVYMLNLNWKWIWYGYFPIWYGYILIWYMYIYMSINMFMFVFLTGMHWKWFTTLGNSRFGQTRDGHGGRLLSAGCRWKNPIVVVSCCTPCSMLTFMGRDMPIPVWLVQILRRLLELPRLLFQSEWGKIM